MLSTDGPTSRALSAAIFLIAVALVPRPLQAQTSPLLEWDESDQVDGFAVTVDGVRTDYGTAPLGASGTCGCSVPATFIGSRHTVIVSAYNAGGETPSAPFIVGPTANAGGPYSGGAGVALNVTGAASTDQTSTISSYTWAWGDGTSDPAANVATATHAYAAAGTFNITLTVVDGDGASHAATTTATIAAPPPPIPGSPNPPNGATNVATSVGLTWAASGATAYDVYFGATNPPGLAASNITSASYTPATLAGGTPYFWQIVARNAQGSTTGPVWTFTTATAPPPPSAPGSPSPVSGATNVATNATLAWTSSGATSYDVLFGTTNPPPVVASNTTAASYSPGPLSNSTPYFWQIVARNAQGTTTGPVWTFTTAPPQTPATIARVQVASRSTRGSTSATVSFSAATTPGNWLAVVVRSSAPNAAVAVTDSSGNHYVAAAVNTIPVGTGGFTLGLFYAENITGGTNTITVRQTTGASLQIAAVEYSGVATTNSVDVRAFGQGVSAAPDSGTATTTSNGELLLGAIGTWNRAAITAGTGFTIVSRVPGSSTSARLALEQVLQPAAGAASATATLGASDTWGAFLLAVRPAM